MEIVLFIGRLLLAVPFLMFGINHLTKTDGMAGYASFKGIPSPKAATIASGVVLVLGALSVALGIYGDIGAIALGVVAASTAVLMHNFWAVDDNDEAQSESVHFLKNVGLVGACVITFALFAYGIVGSDYTFTDAAFNLTP